VRVAKDGGETVNVVELLVRASLVKSKSEARRLVEQRGVKIDDAVADLTTQVPVTGTPVIQYGKRKYARITWS
jgi:tyrosyl-tRNA synthetase